MRVTLTTRESVVKATLAVGPRGAQGEQGPPGADGAQGIQGIQGIQGEPGASGASNWDEITGKPSTFPPSTHAHDDLYHPKATADAITLAGVGVSLTDDAEAVSLMPTRGILFGRDGYGTMLPLLGNTLVLLRADGITRQDINAELVYYG